MCSRHQDNSSLQNEVNSNLNLHKIRLLYKNTPYQPSESRAAAKDMCECAWHIVHEPVFPYINYGDRYVQNK